ncbi:Nif3-like dinuclear metal center hexameric protein [Collinsella sp. BA40]|uniref:Nif3-like dinuclear metal center hexameric protein n=1 Tax=Collinsella sp. BA40 TaxID=2560852 RepID=UPI0011CA93AB|nr:Nif3-like dinuclear metal center hexameric protein [Collinsella sp. BA40]TXF36658.1 Nif3-like dinuclear metal center hexameric protein [Collinsella sp. BA40]
MKVQDLLASLLDRYPLATAEAWDHVGLSVGDPSDEVRRVAVALDVTEAVLREAHARGCNVLVTHHPVYIKAPGAFCPPHRDAPSSSGAVFTAIRLGISIISLHTNLDRSLEVRAKLPELLGASARSSLEFPEQPMNPGLGSLVDMPACTVEDLAARCADAFDTTPRVWGDPTCRVHTLAILGGSLGDFGVQAIAAGADAIVCGEAGYHVCQDLAQRGICVILLGHDASELPFVDILANSVYESGIAPADVATISTSHQWWTYTKGERS